jgi:hypothetical protein
MKFQLPTCCSWTLQPALDFHTQTRLSKVIRLATIPPVSVSVTDMFLLILV